MPSQAPCSDHSKLIAKYKVYHAAGNAWPEITKSIKNTGNVDIQIFLIGNRMFMMKEVDETYNPIKKAKNGLLLKRFLVFKNIERMSRFKLF